MAVEMNIGYLRLYPFLQPGLEPEQFSRVPFHLFLRHIHRPAQSYYSKRVLRAGASALLLVSAPDHGTERHPLFHVQSTHTFGAV